MNKFQRKRGRKKNVLKILPWIFALGWVWLGWPRLWVWVFLCGGAGAAFSSRPTAHALRPSGPPALWPSGPLALRPSGPPALWPSMAPAHFLRRFPTYPLLPYCCRPARLGSAGPRIVKLFYIVMPVSRVLLQLLAVWMWRDGDEAFHTGNQYYPVSGVTQPGINE